MEKHCNECLCCICPQAVENLETEVRKIITLIFLVIAAFAYFCSTQARYFTAERQIAAQQKALDRVPTIKEIQRKVGAKEDGVVEPNTIALWERAINNQYAVESFNRMARDTK